MVNVSACEAEEQGSIPAYTLKGDILLMDRKLGYEPESGSSNLSIPSNAELTELVDVLVLETSFYRFDSCTRYYLTGVITPNT